MNKELIDILQDTLSIEEKSAIIIDHRISNEYEKLRILQILRSKKISENSITKNAYSIKWFHTYFLLESLVYFEQGKKSEGLKSLFRNNLSIDDKKFLLTGFTFSEPYTIGNSWYPCRHEMFNDFNNDNHFKEIYLIEDSVTDACSFSACLYGSWLDHNPQNIDVYLNQLIDKFREMRNSFVHEAFPILFLPSYEQKNTAATFTASVIDAYPIQGHEQFRAYECFLDPDEFFPIITKCISSYLVNKYV